MMTRSAEKFEFTDPSTCNSETNLATMSSGGKKNGGCYVSGVAGMALVLLAVLIAVGVGLIVHFAGGDRDIVCQWGGMGEGSNPTSDAMIQECADMASEGNTEICGQCPATSMQPACTDSTTPAPGTSTDTPMLTDVRLPTSLHPEHYDVRLQPYMYTGDPSTFTFKGSVRILIMCMEATSNITLHVNVLAVSNVKFQGEMPMRLDPMVMGTETDTRKQFFIVTLSKNMRVGVRYVLSMDFTSPLTGDLKGLYLSQYTRGDQTVYLATTQLQPTDARKTFPCFDEPAIKSTFNVTLVRPDYLMSISNMPIIDSSETWEEGGITYIADVYEETPKMSTYLLAFVICDFAYKEATTKNNVTYRAYAIQESIDEVDYALNIGVEVLTYFEQYFEIKFPLPKQDMIAIPDFAAGAMENWGLITYRETSMLYNQNVSTEANKKRVAVVVSHELAHQWFGDLVTLSWWDDLWLNEGFASFVEYMGVDLMHPEWNMYDQFVVDALQSALSFDGLISSHPVYVTVDNPDQINEIFDTISYSKGASIIRMMRHFLGEETFRKGLVRYLNETKYSDAFHDELWEALYTQAQLDSKAIDVKAVMDTWTLQMNYPVVTVTRDFSETELIHVRQDRYLVDPGAEDPGKFEAPFGYKWTIPLTLTSSGDPFFNQTDEHVYWMTKDEEEKSFSLTSLPDASSHSGWILANVRQMGYYRVNYQTGNWKALAAALKANHEMFPTSNRAQLINDAWNLAKPGLVALEIPLLVTDYLDKERDHIPWRAAAIELSYVRLMLSLSPLRGAFMNFMTAKVKDPFQHYGLNTTGATHNEASARLLISTLACSYGTQDCLTQASALYDRWMHQPTFSVDPNIKAIVYCFGVESGGWDEWNFALQKYKTESVASEKALLLSAMGCSQEPWILNNYLNLILEENSPIRRQDALTVINLVSGQVEGRPLAWDFFRDNYDKLMEMFGASSFSWSRVISRVTQAFNTEFHLKQIEDFEQSHAGKLGSGERAFQQAKEKTRSNIKWMETNHAYLDQWFTDNNYKNSTFVHRN